MIRNYNNIFAIFALAFTGNDYSNESIAETNFKVLSDKVWKLGKKVYLCTRFK